MEETCEGRCSVCTEVLTCPTQACIQGGHAILAHQHLQAAFEQMSAVAAISRRTDPKRADEVQKVMVTTAAAIKATEKLLSVRHVPIQTRS